MSSTLRWRRKRLDPSAEPSRRHGRLGGVCFPMRAAGGRRSTASIWSSARARLGARRPERRREEHRCIAAPRPRNARSRRGASRGDGPPVVRARRVAGAAGLGSATSDPLPRHRRRQHPTRCSLGRRRPGARGCCARRCRRLHQVAARRLRDHRRRWWTAAVGRPAPTARARACVPARCRVNDPRRADREPRSVKCRGRADRARDALEVRARSSSSRTSRTSPRRRTGSCGSRAGRIAEEALEPTW